MTTWNVKLATKMCSRTKVVNVGTCKNKTLLSAIWEEGLFIPAYLGGFYQPSNAVCLGKRAMVAEGLSKSGLVGESSMNLPISSQNSHYPQNHVDCKKRVQIHEII